MVATEFYCYLLETDDNPRSNRTYIGFTVDPKRRIRQHNSEIKGGAKHTRGRHWKMVALVSLTDKTKALSFEWRWKHRKKKNGRWTYSGPGGPRRIDRMRELIGEFVESHDETVEIVDLAPKYRIDGEPMTRKIRLDPEEAVEEMGEEAVEEMGEEAVEEELIP